MKNKSKTSLIGRMKSMRVVITAGITTKIAKRFTNMRKRQYALGTNTKRMTWQSQKILIRGFAHRMEDVIVVSDVSQHFLFDGSHRLEIKLNVWIPFGNHGEASEPPSQLEEGAVTDVNVHDVRLPWQGAHVPFGLFHYLESSKDEEVFFQCGNCYPLPFQESRVLLVGKDRFLRGMKHWHHLAHTTFLNEMQV